MDMIHSPNVQVQGIAADVVNITREKKSNDDYL